MKVLLLGTTGLLGHNVLLELLGRGIPVVALVRNRSRLALSDQCCSHPLLSVREGSLLNDRDLRNSAADCDAIINCAGTTDMSLLHYDDYLPVNRDLVGRLLHLMEELPVGALVHVSTANTIGFGNPDHNATEDDTIQKPFADSFYAQSKLEGEGLVAEWAAAHPDRHLVVLNPGFMVGAYDTHPSSGKLLLSAYRRRFMAAPKGGKSFVHVGDVAQAAVNALTMGRSGHRYLLTGVNCSLKGFFLLQAQQQGYRQRVISLPNWLVSLAGRLGDVLRCCHIATQLSTRNVRQLMVSEYYDCSKARNELAFPQSPLPKAVSDFYDWYGSYLHHSK